MKSLRIFIFSTLAFYLQFSNASSEVLYEKIKTFVKSVKPEETRKFEFHTTWGENFKDSETSVLFAKKCNPYDYQPAKVACE